MKLLLLSTDQKIFDENSAVRRRIIDYGKIADEIHIVVYTRDKKEEIKISENVYAYPTNTRIKPLYFFDAYRIGKKIIRNWSADRRIEIGNCLISSQDPFETGLVGYLLKRKFKLPLQLQIHTDFLSPYFWRESLKNKIRVFVGKWLLEKANHLRVVSERIKKSIIAFNPPLSDRIVVLPIFVDIEKIENAPIKTNLKKKYPDRFIILSASRFTVEKNISLALRAMREVAKRASKALLILVGSGPEENKIKVLIERYQLKKNVVIENWTDDLISYYKTADLFLMTSNYEGYGLAAVEAAAAGLPIVMTGVGLRLGRIVPVGDQKALAGAIFDLIENPDKRQAVLKEQEKFFKNWSTQQQYLQAIKRFWEDCVN